MVRTALNVAGGDSNHILTRNTSFQAPINIDIGVNMGKESNGQKKLKKILMMNKKGTNGSRKRHGSKQSRVVALLKELENLLEDDNPDTIHLSSSDA